jgi:ArsR family transcriptional regulator
LGFSDEQIGQWFAAAGLDVAKIETLVGGELTVKLWLGRKSATPGTNYLHEVKAA